MKVKWTKLGMVFFLLLSSVMTGCFIWQYRLPKAKPVDVKAAEEVKDEIMCPRFPEPVPLVHPIPVLMDALDKADVLLRNSIDATKLPAISAIVIFNDSVLWNGNFGRRNGSDPTSSVTNEYTVYRIASLSKIFPTLMLYKLWEDGKVDSLDDPLGKYLKNFTIKNPLGKRRDHDPKSVSESRSSKEVHISSVTLRRMASQLSGLPRRLRATTLLWKGNTQAAVDLLQDDVLVADPGTKCHYSNLAFSLLAHVMAEKVAGMDYQRWVTENILQPLGMEDTGFEITPQIKNRMAVGVYSSGRPAPLYDLGWYRPSGQMYSTPADMAKLAMMLLGAFYWQVLQPDTLKTMLTPLFRCENSYFANQTGTPWEVNEQLGYDVIRKDGDLDGYSASISLVPRLKLGLVILMAGSKPVDEDLVAKTYSYIIPAMESAFRDTPRVLIPPPDPTPYVGYFTYSNITFYEIKANADGVLSLEQFGPQVDDMVPVKYRSLKLTYLQDRVFRLVFEKEYPCQLKVNAASVSLESQDGQLFNFYIFNKKGLSSGFDVPGLNTYKVMRIFRRPIFSS
ncbi:putative beta-lactamase-like 1 [Danio rerio]|uniref:Beta-lactamase-like 1 n=3 Tax=Danio rerio TaxID=7955 RepID=A0A8M9PE02_DANRE|nr:putative beta-lactamase-like 1 [Danio rerio]XP_021325627.1 putative beta-lactamase-like 1 [Danio rerio]XP_021329337.1 putative beta-lactamase-like 1 [Danio rerio]XP_021329338.1 putative beta-lactamase-like 1 [Danio rerio]|eukprot:XP_021325626.1 putative beta-lactamase-like 1 [Danio rerio]